jgi:hypothetical protein
MFGIEVCRVGGDRLHKKSKIKDQKSKVKMTGRDISKIKGQRPKWQIKMQKSLLTL